MFADSSSDFSGLIRVYLQCKETYVQSLGRKGAALSIFTAQRFSAQNNLYGIETYFRVTNSGFLWEIGVMESNNSKPRGTFHSDRKPRRNKYRILDFQDWKETYREFNPISDIRISPEMCRIV